MNSEDSDKYDIEIDPTTEDIHDLFHDEDKLDVIREIEEGYTEQDKKRTKSPRYSFYSPKKTATTSSPGKTRYLHFPSHIGLVNQGNSCYINAVMQIFLQSPELFSILERCYVEDPTKLGEKTLTDELTWTAFLVNIQKEYASFAGIDINDQCDSYLFFAWLLDAINEKLMSCVKKEQHGSKWWLNRFRECMHFQRKVVYTCLECNAKEKGPDATDILLSLYCNENPDTPCQVFDLTDLYNLQYGKVEIERKCTGCQYTKCIRNEGRCHAPSHLFFSINAQHASLHIPEMMDLYTKMTYILKGFIVHKGSSSNYGHYMIYTYHEEEDAWYCYDDDEVTRVWAIETKLQGNVGRFTSLKLVWYVKQSPFDEDIDSS